MGPEGYAEKTEISRLLEAMDPRKRRLLEKLVRGMGIDDPRIIKDILRIARM